MVLDNVVETATLAGAGTAASRDPGQPANAAEVDLYMLLGANFPEHQGGLTPMLDLSWASRPVWGREFHSGPGFAE